MQTNDLTLVIPAYNEEASLRQFLPELLEFCGSHGFQLVIVDDCSKDKTGVLLDEAAEKNAFLQVFHHKVNRGYGGALISGLRLSQTRFSVTLDADGQHRLEDVLHLLEKQQETNADLVVGCRASDSGGGSGFSRALGKKMIRFIAGRLVDNLPISDLNSGMKLYDTELAKRYLRLCPDGMAFSEVLPLVFIQEKHLVTETPITVVPRRDGKSTINTMTALDTMLQIINIVMVFNPMRIFLPIGGVMILLGLLWAIPFLIRGSGLSSVSMMAMTAGLLLIMMGLLAEQLAQIRKKDL